MRIGNNIGSYRREYRQQSKAVYRTTSTPGGVKLMDGCVGEKRNTVGDHLMHGPT
jgi:hypothetical protein